MKRWIIGVIIAVMLSLSVSVAAASGAQVYGACTIPEYNYFHPTDCVVTLYQWNGYYYQQVGQQVTGSDQVYSINYPWNASTYVTGYSPSYSRSGQTGTFMTCCGFGFFKEIFM